MIYLSYSQGFRSGFPQEASVPADAGIGAARPDRLTNYELGSKGNLAQGRFEYVTAIYYMNWRDIQQALSVYSPVYEQYTSAIVNSQSASGVGIDAAISFQVTRGLLLRASMSWNQLEMDGNVYSQGDILFHRGDRPNSSPETTASLGADYSFELGRDYVGKLSVSANYTSAQDYRGVGNITNPIVQAGDPMVFSRAAFVVDFPSHWSATLYGDNLNNERGSPVEAFVGTANWNARVRPRTFGVQLAYHLQ
jgi:outer membrane receptor protein involved in Fe transport